MNGFLGKLFDFNRDGKSDSFERTADFVGFTLLTGDDEEITELEISGLEPDELEAAGLDPDDYDF